MAEQASVRDETQSPKLPASNKSMHPVTLRFADPVLERHYHDSRLRYRFVAGRMSSLAGALAWLAFIVLGILVERHPPPLVRFTTIVACIGMLGMFGLHFMLKPGRWVEIAGIMILLANFCLLLFLTSVNDPADSAQFAPVTVFTMTAVMSFALVGVTFWEGARIAAVAIAFYYIAVTALQPQSTISILYQSAWMLTTTDR